jgi:hypothetical protein
MILNHAYIIICPSFLASTYVFRFFSAVGRAFAACLFFITLVQWWVFRSFDVFL